MPSVDNAGTRISYDVFGAGPAIVALHGSLMDRRSWSLAGYVDALTDHTLIALDCRGAGESDKPVNPEAYSLEAYVSDAIAVADDVGVDRFVVWGFSWGASIAWAVAEAHPDRVRALIAAGCYTRDHFLDRESVEATRVKPLRELGGAGFYDLAEPFEGPLPGWFRDQFASTLVEPYVAARRAAYSWMRLDAARIAVPALLLNGEREDPERRSLEVAASMANARAEILDGETHCRAFVASEVVVPIVREFLAALD